MKNPSLKRKTANNCTYQKMTDELLKRIRELCNHPWKRELLFQDRIKWNKLWASMDAIEDSLLAINFYLRLPDFNSFDGGYLYIYGLMQALNIQQDAISNMSNALFNVDIDYKKEYPSLYTIREHRNNSIGHPTKRGTNKSFHFISRATLNKNKFTLASFFPKTGKQSKFEEINTLECIKVQGELLNKILEKTMDKLHKDFEKVKTGIKERYFSLKALSGVNEIVQTLDYEFNRIQKDLIANKIGDELELYIFIDSLKMNFKKFQEMISEIDDEFN